MSSFPGLVIGPMDVDNAAQLTAKLGTHNKAHLLLERAGRNFPQELTTALARPLDLERTEAAQEHLDEIEAAIRAVKGRRAWLRDGDAVEDVSVKGKRASERVFSVLFRAASGRSGRGVIGYDVVPAVERTFETQAEDRLVKRAREAGVPVPAEGGADLEERMSAFLGKAEAALQTSEQGKADAEEAAQELRERLERLENPEPFEGYDDLKAPDVIKRIKDGGVEEFGLRGLDAIIAYENTMSSPRSTIVSAAEDAKAAQHSAAAE